jgi:AraC-like DNA-binding protein
MDVRLHVHRTLMISGGRANVFHNLGRVDTYNGIRSLPVRSGNRARRRSLPFTSPLAGPFPVCTKLPVPQSLRHAAAADATVIDMHSTRPTWFDGKQGPEGPLDSTYATTTPKRFDAFQQTVVEAYGPLALSTEDAATFRGRIRFASLGAVQLSEVHMADDLVVRRTPRMIRDTTRDYLKVFVPLGGRCVVAQDGREAALAPGDFVLYDNSRPYSATFSRQALSVMIPRGLLRISPRHLAHLTAQRIGGQQGLGALVSALLRQLGNHAADNHGAGNIYLADAVLDMLSAMFAERLSSETTIDMASGRTELLLRIHAFIDAHLSEPQLDVSSVAAAHHISVRQLAKLFEGEGHTVSQWIRDRRIEHCRRDLTEAHYADKPVGSIAASWGLVNAAYFSRRFKAVHGMTPTEYRAHTLKQRSSRSGSNTVRPPAAHSQ